VKKQIRSRSPLFCDAGPYKGYTRVDVSAHIYLTADELKEYYASEFDIIIKPKKEEDK
jgi:hypothetical protein